MNRCVYCGNELTTGDIHWALGICSGCYNNLITQSGQTKTPYCPDLRNVASPEYQLDKARERITELENKLRMREVLEQLLAEKALSLQNQVKELEDECYTTIFSDGHDKDGNAIHSQERVSYKSLYKKVEENRKYAIKKQSDEIAELYNKLQNCRKKIAEEFREFIKESDFSMSDDCYIFSTEKLEKFMEELNKI